MRPKKRKASGPVCVVQKGKTVGCYKTEAGAVRKRDSLNKGKRGRSGRARLQRK